MNLSDESAGAAAVAKGGRYAIEPSRAPAYARSVGPPGQREWVTPPSLLLQETDPTCLTCSSVAPVVAVQRRAGFYVYRLECPVCGPDYLITGFLLAFGGTLAFWDSPIALPGLVALGEDLEPNPDSSGD